MMTVTDTNDQLLIDTLRSGGVAILRTDTLYGIVARADLETAVERVYAIKSRTPTKSPIVLIGDLSQLFDTYDDKTVAQLRAIWPARVSVVLPSQAAPQWLQRGNASVAYRLPADAQLRHLLLKTGPLIAPSANPEGDAPAMDITEAHRYFGEAADVYADGGRVVDDTPSQLYQLIDGVMTRLR